MSKEFDPIVAAAQASIGAATNILNMVGDPLGGGQAELEEIATDLAEALHTVLSFMVEPDEENGRLLHAVESYIS